MDKRLKTCVIFGGKSSEHDVSILSGISVIKNLDIEKYHITMVYIDKNGKWSLCIEQIDDLAKLKIGESIKNLIEIKSVYEFLNNFDVAFPVLHGKYGEDGAIQGLFELCNIPYVGCKVLASAVGMDKVYTKAIFEKAKIKQVPYIYIKKYENDFIYVDEEFNEQILAIEDIVNTVSAKIKFPMFVKPSNSGSSIGINKSNNIKELKQHILFASKYDYKILIEQGISAREIEVSVLGDEDVLASIPGEVLSAEEFYSYDAKYKNSQSKTKIPADITSKESKNIQNLAIKAFKAIDGKGLSRVDFFIEKETGEIYINEINTLPGFTDISMYSKMLEASGIKYKEILEKLITLAIKNNN